MPFLEKVSSPSGSITSSNIVGLDAALSMTRDVYSPKADVSLSVGLQTSEQAATKRRSCGNSECTSGWTMPWRSRRRPVFEGYWGCSGRCVLRVVQTAVRREHGNLRQTARAEQHRHRVPLGLVMLAQGWITHPQLQEALAQQRANGSGRIGEWLVSECGLDREQVTRGLSLQWGCPVLSLEGFTPQNMALVMPKVFLEEFGLVPLRIAGSRLIYLAWGDRLQASVALAVERMSGLRVESGLLDSELLRTARIRMEQFESVPTTFETSGDEDTLAGRITAILEQKQPIGSKLVRLHQYFWLRIWMERGTKSRAGNVPMSAEDMQDYVFTIGQKDQSRIFAKNPL
jgi:hypothetical protein